MSKPNIIFVSYLAGTCGNALTAFINGMIDPAFVPEITFSPHGNAHEPFDKRGNDALIIPDHEKIDWLLPNDGKLVIDASVYNHEYLKSNPDKKYYTMRDHYDVDHLIHKIENGIFNGKIVYIYNNIEEDFYDLKSAWFFKFVVDCYEKYNNAGKFWWQDILRTACNSKIIPIEDVETKHPLDYSIDMLEKIVDSFMENSVPTLLRFQKRQKEHELILQIKFRDIYNGNTEILNQLSKFLNLPIPPGLNEKLALYASLQPSINKYRKNQYKIDINDT